MFEIGFTELLLVAIVALLVLGPERLPQALRTLGLWIGRMRRSFNAVRDEIEREIGMEEIRRQLHNEAVLEELRRIERSVKSTVDVAAGNNSAPLPQTTARPGSIPAGDSAPAVEAVEAVEPDRSTDHRMPPAATDSASTVGTEPAIATGGKQPRTGA